MHQDDGSVFPLFLLLLFSFPFDCKVLPFQNYREKAGTKLLQFIRFEH